MKYDKYGEMTLVQVFLVMFFCVVGGNFKGPRNLVEPLGSFQRGPPRTQWVVSSSLMNSTGSVSIFDPWILGGMNSHLLYFTI